MDRRGFLEAASTAGVAGLAGCLDDRNSDTEPTEETFSEFVGRDGTEFAIDGERYVFSGVANCCVAERYTSVDRVQSFLDGAADLDADAIRFKIGSSGKKSDCGETVDGCYLIFQPEPGVYNETAFRHLDYIVHESAKRGLRVILPLVDHFTSVGMAAYVSWSDTAERHGDNIGDFYTDEQIQEWYRGFVEHLLTRENTYTGREYHEDPTILMWELANEPLIEGDYEGYLGWVEESAEFIHGLDENHLVSTGSNIYEKEVYEEVHSIDGIDACSIHLWPQNYGWDNPGPSGSNYIKDRVERGKENVGKPVYLGEYGWHVNLQADDVDAQLQRRKELFSRWHDVALPVDIDGALTWELLSDNRLEHHLGPGSGDTVGFHCSLDSGVCSELRSFADRMDERSEA